MVSVNSGLYLIGGINMFTIKYSKAIFQSHPDKNHTLTELNQQLNCSPGSLPLVLPISNVFSTCDEPKQ